MSFFRRHFALILLALGAFTPGVQAANQTQNVDIHVSITAAKSLSVNTTSYEFGALPISSTVVSASSITVINDSGGLIETYTVQGASATADGGVGTDWALAASPGTDTYSLAAQFANPGNIQSSWNSDDLTFSAVSCSADQFGNGTPTESGYQVFPNASRGLWLRIKTPTAVTDTMRHTATITLAVQ